MLGGGGVLVTHIGQGGMADDWWQSVSGKIAAPPILSWESGAKQCGDLSGIYGIVFERKQWLTFRYKLSSLLNLIRTNLT